jgi:ubiquinone/menaquinone biosynthesis C-methylase UbiE
MRQRLAALVRAFATSTSPATSMLSAGGAIYDGPMRYGAIAETPLEEQLLSAPQSPRAVFDTFLPLVQARAIMAAVRLGVFQSLRDSRRSRDELGRSLALDTEALELVLRVLVGSGYLTQEGDAYALSELARLTLLDDGPARVVAYVGLDELAWDWLGHTSDVVRDGHGIDMHSQLADSSSWATYQRAMLEIARQLAPLVAQTVPVKQGAQKLLDIAGSHGLFGALICREHPPMRSVVLDLPEAVEQSRQLATEEGLDDVVTHRAGDALVDDLGDGQDVVFLGNILHHFTPGQIEGLLERIRRALSPSGTVAIWEIRRPEPSDPPDIMGDGFALFFRVTSTARCYRTSEYLSWLTAAGFDDVQAHPLPVAPFQLLATGRVPS